MQTSNRLSLILAAAFFTGSAWADVIGSLDSSARYQIRAADQSEFVNFSQSDYTWFSGDTIRTRSGPAVLHLAAGGGIGFPQDVQASVTRDGSGTLKVNLESGSILYALDESETGVVFQAGNFSLTTSPTNAERMNVSAVDGAVGSVELLADGNIKVAVRSGALFVENGNATRYRVGAGESVGLLDLPEQSINVQRSTRVDGLLIEIESPEQVGTGEEFRIRWNSTEPGSRDYIVVAPEGAEADEFDSVISTSEGEILEFEAPASSGDYEIRYIDGESGEVRKFVYLDVVADPAAVVWWRDPVGPILGTGLGVAAGAIGIHIIDQSRNETRRPVSP